MEKIITIIVIASFLMAVLALVTYGFVTPKWISREFQFRRDSAHLVYKWICIKYQMGQGPYPPNSDANFNWYDFYLNESPKRIVRYKHIWQVWRQKDEYEEISAFVEEHKKEWEEYVKWAIQLGIFSSDFAVSIS